MADTTVVRFTCISLVIFGLCHEIVVRFQVSGTISPSVQKPSDPEQPSSAHEDQNHSQSISVDSYVASPSPCSMTSDSGGITVNCEGRGISDINSEWFPWNTTTIILDKNNISCLVNNTFSHLSLLRHLSVQRSNLRTIQVDALRGLSSLVYLNLEGNVLPLKDRAFPKGMFRHVSSLRQLYIGSNTDVSSSSSSSSSSTTTTTTTRSCNGSGGGENNNNTSDDVFSCQGEDPVPRYSDYIDIFDNLAVLEVLSIDTFSVLRLGDEFAKLKNLKSLVLYGTHILNTVTNDSFVGLQSLQLKELALSKFARVLKTFENAAFQYLYHLTSLTIQDPRRGNTNIADSLSCFVNRTLTSVTLRKTSFGSKYASPTDILPDGLITKRTMKYLGQICISHMAWTNSDIFAMEPSAVATPQWQRCLQTLDLSKNPIGHAMWRAGLFKLLRFSVLESITFTSRKSADDFVTYIQPLDTDPPTETFRSSKEKAKAEHRIETAVSLTSSTYQYLTSTVPLISHQEDLTSTVPLISHQEDLTSTVIPFSLQKNLLRRQIIINLPPALKNMKLSALTDRAMFILNEDYILKNSQNFQALYATEFPNLISGAGRWLGLHNLTVIDFTSSGLRVADYFFDEFPAVEILVLHSILPDHYFDTVMPCKRLIRNMTKLWYLDISSNGLNSLLPSTFSMNPLLKYLNLADNRFSSIPFDLRLTPKLEVLNLSRNAIQFLTEGEMVALDRHVSSVKNFYLHLQGNALVCVCSQIKFMGWLNRTSVMLDNNGNYTCSSQTGQITTTAAMSDELAVWRQCNGWSWFMFSLLLVLLLIVSFLITYLMTKFSYAIEAFIIRIVAPQFRPLTPNDYKADVFIGYAEDDYVFVRYVLREFLEKELHLRTIIHQRDFLQHYEGDQFFEAIQGSWRVMLVITENFLKRDKMAHNIMMFASTTEGPLNRGRVFVLVNEDQLHGIPDFLYAVLDDPRIILISDFTHLKYDHKQAIKSCLRPVGLQSPNYF